MFRTKDKKNNKKDSFAEFIKILVQAFILTFLFRSLLFQPFVIPSGSMRPTLLVGDYILVNKFSYGYSRYSFPMNLDFIKGRLFFTEPKRGDIVVFNHKDAYDGTRKDYVKRLIGLPGDVVQLRDGVVYINKQPVFRQKLSNIEDCDVTGEYRSVDCYKEILPNNVTYNTLDIDPKMRGNNTQEFIVPQNHYFMMGDNRDDSEDSRFSLGFIPQEELVGKASVIFFSLSDNVPGYAIWHWFNHLRFSRLFSKVNMLHYEK